MKVLIILTLIFIIINWIELKIYYNDICFLFNLLFNYKYEYEMNKNNNIEQINYENTKVLIFSYDNRIDLPYLDLHNKRFKKYSEKWKNIYYKFFNKCDKNVYWCKMHIMLNELKSNKYDYVMWTDSDVIVVDLNKSIQEILNMYNSDIFISHDNDFYISSILCAGIFVVKNSETGINFLTECIDKFNNSECMNTNGKISGFYSLKCYEQGIMNELIYEKYYKNTTVLSKNIFCNTTNCNNKAIFLHYYIGKEKNKIHDCFSHIVSEE